MAKYLSNRQKNLKVGIVSYTESNTVLEVTGKVGIGTTNAISTLSVVGDTNVTGVVTANSFSGSGSALTGIVTYITAGSGISINQNTGNVTITATGGGGGDGGTGVTIQDEGSVVGVADSITTLNFVGANVSATASGSISTITVADNLVGTALSISGISTFTNGPVLVGSSSSTGTASQSLQVTGGAYVSGNTGIRTTNPQSALDVRGAISIGRTDVAGINSIRSVIDINSWEYGGVFKATGTEDATPQDIYFKDDGTKMYILGDSGNEVNEYALSTAWDVSTAGFTTVFSTASQETSPLGLYFKPDGTRMYICGNTAVSPANADQVRSYTLSTPWSIASGSITYDNKAYTTTNTAPQGVYFKDDGLKMYVVDSTFDGIYEYSLSTAWELDSTITLLNSVPLGTANTLNLPLSLAGPSGINFNTSGTKMYITDITRDVVARFDLATPWDTTTISFYDNVYVGFQELAPCGIFYQEDQSKAYIVGTSNDTVYQFNTDVPSLELASSGISTRSSIILNNEARLNNRLYVTGDTHISSNTNVKGSLTVDGSTTIVSNLTVSGGTITAGNVAATLLGNTSTNIVMAGSQTTGTLQIGAAAQTGTMTVGLSTASQTTNIQAGANASGTQKTINLGTGGLAGSRTLITVGSATAGAISTVTIPSPTNLLIGTATTTGTASQPLQVTGGAYVSGSVGIGTTNPLSKLDIQGDATVFGVLQSQGFLLTGIATISVNSSSDALRINQLGSGNALVVEDSANPDATPFVINASGNLGVGRTNPSSKLEVLGTIQTYSADTTSVGSFSISNLGLCDITAYKSTGGALRFVTANSSGNNLDRGRVDSSGNFIIGNTSETGTASQRLQVTGGAYVSGDVGIGQTNPLRKLHVRAGSNDGLYLDSSDQTGNSGSPTVRVRGQRVDGNTSQSFAGTLVLEKYRMDATINSGQNLGNIIFGGNFSTAPGITTGMTYGASISGVSEGSFSDINIAPTAIVFNTGTVGLGTLLVPNITYGTEAARITSNRNLLIGATSETGTSSQRLQVTGGAYVSTRLGIGQTNPNTALHIGPYNGNDLPHLYLGSGNNLFGWRFDIQDFGGGSVPLRIWRRLNGTDTEVITVLNQNGNVGIGTTNPTSKLSVVGDGNFTGVVTATTFIGALTGTATTASSVTVNSVGLGTHTYGDYVKDITGTANQITVTSGTGEGSSPTLSIPSQFTAPQDVTVTRDLQVNRNLNVTGNITIGGTSATIFSQTLNIFDPDIVLGFRTDALGNDTSTDNTANHGGIAIASTEGTPLISLYDVGVGETNPSTYKKFMWFKSGTFSGLGTDAWISNYAIGIGSTQVPNDVRLAAGGMQVTDSTLSVPQLNISGVSTFTGAVSFGTSAYFGDNDKLIFGDGGDLEIYHDGNNSVIRELGTGLLSIQSSGLNFLKYGTSEYFAQFVSDGSVSLYYDNSKKFETTGVGVTVFGTTETQQLVVSDVSTFQNNVFLGDNDSLYFGDSNDLRIWHNGTHSNIADVGTGDLYLGGNNNVVIADGALSETKAKFITNGAVELYYDNTKEFETTGYGATVFGTLQSQGLNVSGVTTSSGGFVGNLTGTATTATNLADAANITTGTINSARLSGTYDINVSYASTAGIATVAQGLTGTPNISVGVVTATSFVKSGGTSSQFLKADGSVDSSTYLASYTETDTLNSVTGRGNSTVNGISIGILTATSGNFSGIVTSSGAVISGATTATSFVKSGGTSSQFLKADGSVDSSTYLTTTGSGTNLTGIVTSITAGTNITISNSTGNVTINAAGGGGGGGSGTFDTGISTSIYISVTSGVGINTTQTNDIFVGPGIAGTTIGIGYSFPSTAGRKYVIESIHVTNTFSNELYLVARHDFSGGSAVPTVQRVVIPYQGSAELLSQPIIANPSDILRFQALSGVGNTAVGIDGGLDAFVVYSTKTDTNYVGTGATVTSSTGTGIFTSTTYPSVIQSIRICNYNLNIDVDASISIYRGTVSAGVRLGYLVYNMTIPKNSVIEILEKPKYLATNDTIVAVGSTTNSLGVTVSGKYIV
jgi:hypothetical protein